MERARQDLKWGQQDHDDGTWIRILMEEVGEACEASLEAHPHTEQIYPLAEMITKKREELTHAAAVLVAWLESEERKNQPREGTDYTTYLAGPILDCEDIDIYDWRKEATEILKPPVLDPTRRVYQEDSADIVNLVEEDKNDIINSYFILANCWKPSHGTSMEIFYAWTLGKFIISIVPEGVPVSAWVRYHSTKVIRTLEEAVKIIHSVY